MQKTFVMVVQGFPLRLLEGQISKEARSRMSEDEDERPQNSKGRDSLNFTSHYHTCALCLKSRNLIFEDNIECSIIFFSTSMLCSSQTIWNYISKLLSNESSLCRILPRQGLPSNPSDQPLERSCVLVTEASIYDGDGVTFD